VSAQEKWRPSLWFVLGGALGSTLLLSLLGMVALRYLGPEIGFKNAAYLLTIGIGAITVIIWLLLLRLLLRPVTALQAYAEGVGAGLETPAPGHFGTRELRSMGRQVMGMAMTLSNREQTVRNFTDHVIHEVKTPVTAVQAATELLEDSEDLTDADRKLVLQIRSAGKQMQAQLAALREMVMAREANYHGSAQLVSLFDKLMTEHADIEFRVEGGAVELPMSGDGLLLILGHLIRNSASHGATEVAFHAQENLLRVRDNGPGISEGNQSRVFDPFFTTRRETGGTGMGLYSVSSLLQAHNAEISLAQSDAGALFEIKFQAK
jgi:signal transduction histidine kinase